MCCRIRSYALAKTVRYPKSAASGATPQSGAPAMSGTRQWLPIRANGADIASGKMTSPALEPSPGTPQ
ncbi:protein of unknown function [Pseudomonas mediterranea]